MFQAQQRDPLVFIGAVEGYPEIDVIESWLKDNQVKTAWLLPFMSVAGDHAKTTWPEMRTIPGNPFFQVPELSATLC